MWTIKNVFVLLLFKSIKAQLDAAEPIDIKQKSKDGFIHVPIDETKGTKEIYTSMHQLHEFFQDEKAYIEDLKTIIEKRLVSQSAVTGLGKLFLKDRWYKVRA